MDINSKYACCIKEVHKTLKPYGYSKKGQVFKKDNCDTLSIIQFQRDISNTNEILKFTINLAVIVKALYPSWRGEVQKADAYDGNLRVRLNKLFDEKRDFWWCITKESDCEILSAKISHLVSNFAIPYLETYSKIDNLVELWETGKSPGATNKQRLDFLACLKLVGVNSTIK